MAPGLPDPTQQRRGLTGNQTADELIQAHANLSPPAQAAIGMSKIPAIAETNLAPTLPPNAPLVNPAVTEPPSAATTTLAAPSKVRGFGPLPGSPEAARADELHRLETSPPGIVGATNRINNPFLRGLARVGGTVGDVIASGVFPNFGAFVPGTSAHHAVLVNQAANAVRRDQQEQAAEDEQRLREAQAGHLETETDELGNPKPAAEEFSTVPTSEGIVSFNKRTGAGSPLTVGGKVAQPIEKPQKGQPVQFHQLQDGRVVAESVDPDTGEPKLQVIYKGEPGLKTEVKQIEIGGKPHQVLLNSQTGETIKDLGETGEKPPTVNVNAGENRRFQEQERGRGLLDKAETAYRNASAHADALASFIDAARAGNKVAASAQPLEGTLSIVTSQGVTRINRNELEGIAGAGDLWDRITGKLGKWTAGQPIPPDVQKDFSELAGLLKRNAYKTYREAHDSAVKRYGLEGENPLPEPGGATFQQTATGPGGHKIGSNDGGKTWIDIQTGKPVQ